jgi:glycine cleavage system H protein
MYPTDRKYTREHEWIRPDGDEALVGITDFAQRELGDVVYVDLPAVGTTLKTGEKFGEVESVKTVSELYSPVAGVVVSVNPELANHPERVNSAPHESWMIRVRPAESIDRSSTLIDAAAYESLVQPA